MANNLSYKIKTAQILAPVAAGTSDQTSSAVDMANFEGCRFLVSFGAITSGAVTSIKVQQSSDDGSADTYADLAGTAQTVADTDDDKVFVIDVYAPRERYLKVVVDRGTQNAVINCIIAEQYGARGVMPLTNASTCGGQEAHVSPAEGTA